MVTLTRDVVASFLRLKAPEFDPYTGFLRSVYQQTLEEMAAIKDPDHWRKLQGKAQFAKELLEYVESSNGLVAKFDSRPQQSL